MSQILLKNFLRLFKKEYQTLNTIEISKKNLLQNYKYLFLVDKKVKIAPVLKSNAYGHGLVQTAKILEGCDDYQIPFFCVDSLYEAYELLKANVKTKILVMGYTNPENLKIKKLPFSFAVYDLETVRVLNKYQANCGIHIFVDTGMNREGIQLEDLPKFLEELKLYKNLNVEGLMSHFASADEPKDSLNKKQFNNFTYVRRIVRKFVFKPKWIHIQNSDALASHTRYVNVNTARVGLALYGISNNPNLKPVLTFKSKIIQIKKLRIGDIVGYGGTFTAKKPMVLGVLPLGYFDGVDRRLSNKGFVIVNGQSCKIIGRVSMNITTIDLTKIPNPQIDQEALVYSSNPQDKNSIQNTARICKSIPYDILIHLSASTKRVIV